ncbi:MAG: hypothetical protein G01um101438_976 [Parcubacteria group bacterium Gr01-1014_38]|nr:MAG: hypothetical protein G01um101438_976 [Parcubacteria group bacterium Gr01-1014_38]
MSIMRIPSFALVLLAVPGIVLAQEPGTPGGKIACLRTELIAAGLPASVTEELLAGRLANPEQVVKSTLGDTGLHRVAQACFPEETGTLPAGAPRPDQASGQPHSPVQAGIPADVAACLQEKVGEQAFIEVSSGQRPPTPAEIERGKACFPSGPPGGGEPIGDLPAETRACIVGILGEQVFEDMRQGRVRPETISPELMRRVGLECFKEHAETIQGANPDVAICFRSLEQRYGRQAFEGGPPSGELQQAIEECLRKDPHYRGSMMPSSGADPGACVDQCTQLEGGKFSREQCTRMCAGQPPAGGPPPAPGTIIGPDQCVQECSRFKPPETCQQLCTGSGGGAPPAPFPTEFPLPSYTPFPGSGPYPQPYPTGGTYPQPYPESSPAPGQNCTTTCETINGATRCQTQCTDGNVQGATTEREAPWLTGLTRFLLNLIGF